MYSDLIFMHMGNKSRHLRIRLSEAEYKLLSDILIKVKCTKSLLVRNALNAYLIENFPREVDGGDNLNHGSESEI